MGSARHSPAASAGGSPWQPGRAQPRLLRKPDMTPPKPAGSDGSAAAGPSLLPCSGQTGFRENSTPSTLRLRGCLPPTLKLAEAWSPDSVSAKNSRQSDGSPGKDSARGRSLRCGAPGAPACTTRKLLEAGAPRGNGARGGALTPQTSSQGGLAGGREWLTRRVPVPGLTLHC